MCVSPLVIKSKHTSNLILTLTAVTQQAFRLSMTVNKQVINELIDVTRLSGDTLKHTSLSLDSVKHTKVESSLASPADVIKRAVSTVIHEDGLSAKTGYVTDDLSF